MSEDATNSMSRRHFGFIAAGASLGLASLAAGSADAAPVPSAAVAPMLDAKRYRVTPRAIDETYVVDVMPVISPFASPATGEKLPVVFVLDGNWMFPMLSSTALILSLAMNPSVLVVGVGYDLDLSKGAGPFWAELAARRTRDYTPSLDRTWLAQFKKEYTSRGAAFPTYGTPGGGKAFLAFLNEELKPFVAARYPNADMSDTTIAGHSFGGLFALYALFTAPKSFQRYIAASPTLFWDNGLMFKLAKTWGGSNARLFMSVGGDEPMDKMVALIKRMDAFFKDRSPPNFTSAFQRFANENHGSVIPAALSRGLREVFKKSKV